ncbi:MAG: hypothetical protein R2681_02175 [Pyrinomonadaceae bacterium]
MRFKLLSFVFLFSAAIFSVSGQSNVIDANASPEQQQRDALRRTSQEGSHPERASRINSTRIGSPASAMGSFRVSGGSSRSFPKPEMTGRDRELIEIDKADANKFSQFLKQRNTGFMRLHDRAGCLSVTVNVNEPCPWNVYSKATAFSFRKENYVPGLVSDIALFDAKFITIGVMQQTVVTDLGLTEIDNLSLRSAEVRDLLNITPEFSKARTDSVSDVTEMERISRDQGIFAIEGHAYLMRAIAFKGKLRLKELGNQGSDEFSLSAARQIENFDVIRADKRRDIIVVFKVIRSHRDGSISIIWKELQSKEAPAVT